MPHFASDITNQLKHAEHATERDAIDFTHQAQKLAHLHPSQEDSDTGSTQAVEAKFVTPLDPVVETANGGRLPAIPVEEAARLNQLKDAVDGRETPRSPPRSAVREGKDGTAHGSRLASPPAVRKPRRVSTEAEEAEGIHPEEEREKQAADTPLREAIPPSRTNPLFPPLPLYGPPTLMRRAQCWFFRIVSSVLSLCFLLAIVAGAIADAIPHTARYMLGRATLRNPTKKRPFYEEEMNRKQERRAAQKVWVQQKPGKGTRTPRVEKGQAQHVDGVPQDGEFVPTEGGPDPLIVDIGYYARRVGLDAESFDVQTEDGFVIQLIHLFNPREYRRPPEKSHEMDGPDVFEAEPRDSGFAETQRPFSDGKKKYPVLMMHGLLQSAGAYCATDDDSLAFYLAKSGYDVWLGNNRCGFEPRHTMLKYQDPRMWAWNIRQMGVMDLPAFISRVLAETGFPKLALIAHSQGTTQTFVALAKEQRPEIGEKISVFCALAPAAYAGPLIGKIYLKVMSVISPGVFRLIFGIHSFIPLMMVAHKILPAGWYGWMGYHVFSFLFSWSDARWDRGLRNRMFQWAPTYVSAESMRWWLGRECFAKQKCILATREEGRLEDQEDEEDDHVIEAYYAEKRKQERGVTERRKLQRNLTSFKCQTLEHLHHRDKRGQYAWYNEQFPPLALWVAGADDLVDGRRLLRRFDRGREPHVRIVHKKIIEGYEHLDVIWAMDSIEKVGKEVREVIWRTVDHDAARVCRVPVGCEKPFEEDPHGDDVPMMHSGGRLRMASISEGAPSLASLGLGHVNSDIKEDNAGEKQAEDEHAHATEGAVAVDGAAETEMDASRETSGEHDHLREETREFGTGTDTAPKDAGMEASAVTGRRRGMSEAVFTDLQEKGNPLG